MTNSKIAWTDHTFNPWLFPQSLTTPQLASIPDTVWLEMLKFVACMAKGKPIFHYKAQIFVRGKWHDMVGSKVPTLRVFAFLTGIFVAGKNSITPNVILCFATVIKQPLFGSIFPSIMSLSARGSLLGYLANLTAGFLRVLRASPITAPQLGRRAHFRARFNTHLLSLHRGHEVRPTENPSGLQFLTFVHP